MYGVWHSHQPGIFADSCNPANWGRPYVVEDPLQHALQKPLSLSQIMSAARIP